LSLEPNPKRGNGLSQGDTPEAKRVVLKHGSGKRQSAKVKAPAKRERKSAAPAKS